jgi:serralysin
MENNKLGLPLDILHSNDLGSLTTATLQPFTLLPDLEPFIELTEQPSPQNSQLTTSTKPFASPKQATLLQAINNQVTLPQPVDTFGVPVATSTVTATGDNNIDGLLSGVKWASTQISFSFTSSINDYESGYADRAAHGLNFQSLNATQRAVARAWIGTGGEFYNISLLSPVELTGANDRNATIRMAMSDVPGTAFAYYPNDSFVEGGDVWFNTLGYNDPVIGNYAYHTFGHELGHALGLKHGQELGGVRNVAMNADRDSMEFSIMTYRSYVGHDLDALPYYTNEAWGYAQSLMMYDIRAIQEMYGAWFGYNGGNTTYTFSSTTGEMFINGVGQGTPGANRIFRTIWDGNGIDTYDFSNYTTNLAIDLTPGSWTDLDVGGNNQRAMLNAGYGGVVAYARAHVFNALQYNGDLRSLIENANGGSGNDTMTGNVVNNVLNGNDGNDTINGGVGADITIGANGNDRIIDDDYVTFDIHDGGDGVDTIDYSNVAFASGFVTINLATGLTSVSGGNTETILNFENVEGSGGGETIIGSAADNVLYGNGGDDTLYGGDGMDYLSGGENNDSLYGELGNDDINGGSGNDYLSGGDGNDNLDGLYDNDYLDGGDGNDLLRGYYGNDYLLGGFGDDSLYGEADNDTLDGWYGSDIMYGGTGDDTLTGWSDDDSLYGEDGNDVLKGESGIDTLTGGLGADQFFFNTVNEGVDTITDFTWWEGDKIVLSVASLGARDLFAGALATWQFVIGTTTTDYNQRFIYDNSTGALSFDVDGIGSAAQVQFATLSVGLPLIASDILLV